MVVVLDAEAVQRERSRDEDKVSTCSGISGARSGDEQTVSTCIKSIGHGPIRSSGTRVNSKKSAISSRSSSTRGK